MTKSYLIMEKGLIKEIVFPLETQATIGRSKGNDVRVSDPSVSKRHAVVYLMEDQAIVEDLGSRNGTYLHGERVKKAVLSSGDKVQIGTVTFRFLQEEESQEQSEQGATREFNQADISEDLGGGLSEGSRRVIEAISKAPLFSNLSKKSQIQISLAARLVLFAQGKTIIQQGDMGRSLYIILDGKVRVFTYDNQGKEVPVSFLTDNQLFGEISFLTGAPRAATVQAEEETLVCELKFELMREIVQSYPAIRAMLEQYHRERLRDLEAKKRAAGVVERRRHPRFNGKLLVRFHFPPTSQVSSELKGRVFQAISSDISISGIRIKVQDRSLFGLPVNCELRLEINLPRFWDSIRCLGILRNIVEGKEGSDLVLLGIEFAELPPEDKKKLERLLLG